MYLYKDRQQTAKGEYSLGYSESFVAPVTFFCTTDYDLLQYVFVFVVQVGPLAFPFQPFKAC